MHQAYPWASIASLNDRYRHGAGLVVGDIEDGAGRVAVDELDAKYLGLREGCFDVQGEGGRLKFSLVAYFAADFLDVFDLNITLAPS